MAGRAGHPGRGSRAGPEPAATSPQPAQCKISGVKGIAYTSAAVTAALTLAVATPVQAQGELDEFAGTKLPLAIHDALRLEVLPPDVPAAREMAEAFPQPVEDQVVLRLFWPRGDSWSADTPRIVMAVGVAGLTADALTTYLLMQSPDGSLYQLEHQDGNGELGRLCVWPNGAGGEGGLLLMYSMYRPDADNEVHGYAVMDSGEVWDIETGNAHTVNGWFSISDLDHDGSFELVTHRMLDGVPSGFTYRAVRSFDAQKLVFTSDPEPYTGFFQVELDWLNWVVGTRALIQENPERYMDREGAGPVFSDWYEGELFGFDSIIEVPVPEGPEFAHIEQFNRDRVRCFQRVVKYRDDLAAWLAGGAQPAYWNIR